MVIVPLSAARAQDVADTLRLREAIEVARAMNPSIRAALLRADVAVERVAPAGAWMNPMLSFGLMNRPVSNFGTQEPMTMNAIEVTQQIPWPGKRGFAQDRAILLAEADSADAEEVERRVIARVKSTYARVGFMDRSLDVMHETRVLLANFLEVSTTLYTVGDGLQQDVLQAQIAVAQMTEDITVMEEQRTAMTARLNALLGRPATGPIAAVELADTVVALASVDTLMVLATLARPALHAAQLRIDAADAGYRAARRQLYPDINVRLGYGQRPEFADMVTIMVGVRVPIFASGQQLPLRREMEAVRASEEARERDLYNETYARIAELHAQAGRALRLSSLYANSVLPQARAAVESALAAYRVGRVEYTTLVQNEMTVNRYEIESLRLIADYQQAIAELEALVGSDLGGVE